MDTLLKRKPAYVPTDAEVIALDAFFAAHPESTGAYLFYDGRIIDVQEYQRRMTSRTAQLVAIFSDGFPVSVSRLTYRYGREKP